MTERKALYRLCPCLRHLAQRFICIAVLMLGMSCLAVYGQVLYVSPTGDDNNTGARHAPLGSIVEAFGRADAGAQIRLLPGRYLGLNRLSLNQGEPERPISIIGHSTHPDSLAIIDGGGQPGLDQPNTCFLLVGIHWITIQNLTFRNCWTDSITIAGSSYITIAGNDFLGGRRAIQPTVRTHHVLVENNTFEQDMRVWTTWAWDDLHHGEHIPLSHFNGALFHPKESDGAHVMRGNVIKNVFNGFRTDPDRLDQDANIEVYDNTFINVRDNAIEPEQHVWNHHYYGNRLFNSRKSFSIDAVTGGGVYIWGNVQWQEATPMLGLDTQGGSRQRISGLWKFRESALSDTVWIFNNSFYTEARVFKDLRLPFTNIQHINNAYAFFGKGEWALDHWETSYRFDYDCANVSRPDVLQMHGQAVHSVTTSTLFSNPLDGDLVLDPASPCRDAGTVLRLPAFGWSQTFTGAAPDIGSFEDTTWVEGPPFRYREPPGADGFDERPRIVRHRVDDHELTLYFSAPLEAVGVDATMVRVFDGTSPVAVQNAILSDDGYGLVVTTTSPLDAITLALAFDPLPRGVNGQPVTYWASTVRYAFAEAPTTGRPTLTASEVVPPVAPTLSLYPNPASTHATLVLSVPQTGPVDIDLYDLTGRRLHTDTALLAAGQHRRRLNTRALAAGLYVVRIQTASGLMAHHSLMITP